jgi:hypothetical protein
MRPETTYIEKSNRLYVVAMSYLIKKLNIINCHIYWKWLPSWISVIPYIMLRKCVLTTKCTFFSDIWNALPNELRFIYCIMSVYNLFVENQNYKVYCNSIEKVDCTFNLILKHIKSIYFKRWKPCVPTSTKMY